MIQALIVTLVLSFSVFSFAKVTAFPVPVSGANSEAKQMRGPHLAFWGSSKAHVLVVSLGGTNSLPSDMTAFDTVAAEMGFDVLTVDYDNSVISTTCKDSKDLLCFDHFRQEVVTGATVSDLVSVNPPNSLEARIFDALKWLEQNNSNNRWGRYVKNGKVDWSRVILVGHSQGSGHAAYLAKTHPAKAAILLAGPQDRFADGREVHWLKQKSQTSVRKYFGLLHEKDFFGSEYQIAGLKQLLESSDISSNVIISATKVPDPHMAVIQPLYTPEWKKLLAKANKP